MSVVFRELAGSPEEEYTASGFRAQRRFLVPWEDRHRFAVEALGSAADHGGRGASRYPGQDGVFAVGVRLSPADPDSLSTLQAASGELADDLADYAGGFALAVVEYASVPSEQRGDLPSEGEAQLSYRMEHGYWERPLLASGFAAVDDPQTPLPPELPLTQIVPYTDHHLTWRQVMGPPWQAMRELQGTVNNDMFLGLAAGRLLFLGATTNKLFRGDFAEGVSPFCWEIRYQFRELALKHGGLVYGWNAVHRPDPAGFVDIADSAGPLYDSGDFTRLFQQELA